MKSYLLIICFFISLVSFSQKVKTSDLQGSWRVEFVVSNLPEISEISAYQDAEHEYYDNRKYFESNEFWVIKDKKVSCVDYPCCSLGSGKLTSTDTSIEIHFEKSDLREMFYTLQLSNDTLSASNFLHTYYLVRDTLDSDTLYPLIRGKINSACLMGTWEIPIGEVSVPFDAIVVWYPWKMVDTFTVNQRNINWYWSKNRFYLDVDGVKRAFKVRTVSNSEGNLILVPERWVKFYIKRDKLEDYMVDHVWLQKVYLDSH